MTRRDDEDAAAVMTVLLALRQAASPMTEPAPRSVWNDPAFRAGARRAPTPGPHAWWASGLPS